MLAPGRPPTGARPLLRLLLVLGMALSSLPGCRKKQEAPAPLAAPIRLACPKNVSAGLVIIAQGKGHLARAGAPTTLLPFESGKAALAHMLSGEADLAVVAETPLARSLLEGAGLKVLASIHQSSADLAIVARRDRGIRSPSDLRGKVIGYTKGTTGHFFLDTFCLVNRIPLEGMRLVDLSPLQLRSALVEGRVDAVSTWQPNVVVLTDTLGPQGVVFRDEFIYTQTLFLVARLAFIRDHPAQVKALLVGLGWALATIAQAPAEARQLVAAYTQVEPALVARVFRDTDFDLRLDQSHLLSLENESRWWMDSGAVPRREPPDALTFFYLPGLLEVRPQAVQIIRDAERDRP